MPASCGNIFSGVITNLQNIFEVKIIKAEHGNQKIKLCGSWVTGNILARCNTWDAECLFRPYPSRGELEHSCADSHACSHRQTIDFSECTSLICGVPLWCELICIISHLKRDVLEAGGGLMVGLWVGSLGVGCGGVYKVPIVQSQDREKAL